MKEECCLLVYSWSFLRRVSMQTPECVFLWLPKMSTQAKAESIFAFRGCHDSETDQRVTRTRGVINIHLHPESWKAKLYIQLDLFSGFSHFGWSWLPVLGLIISRDALTPFFIFIFSFSECPYWYWNEEPSMFVLLTCSYCSQGRHGTFDFALGFFFFFLKQPRKRPEAVRVGVSATLFKL